MKRAWLVRLSASMVLAAVALQVVGTAMSSAAPRVAAGARAGAGSTGATHFVTTLGALRDGFRTPVGVVRNLTKRRDGALVAHVVDNAVPRSVGPALVGSGRRNSAKTVVAALRSNDDPGTALSWVPTSPPLPGMLPSGEPAVQIWLSGTSCASASFCVAVGGVSDADHHGFPVAEILSDGTWTPTVLPSPADAPTAPLAGGVLFAVSCSADGTCAAVGDYDSYNAAADSNYQNALLEVLSDGVWTATARLLPNGPDSGLVNMYSVSCYSAANCTAFGNDADFSGPNSWFGLIYTLSFGSWQLQIAPLPADDGQDTVLAGVSCPTDGNCTIVGSYMDDQYITHGLILTPSEGAWTLTTSPAPLNIAPGYKDGGRNPGLGLDAVDCPEDGSCLAAGYFVDTSYHLVPLLVTLDAGVWTPLEAPVPADAEADPQAQLMGVSCPADGSCVATGFYFINALAGDASGMILVQNDDGTWSASPAPLPPTGTEGGPRLRSKAGTVAAAPASGASLSDVSCGSDGFCAAMGTDDDANFLETGQVSVPTVSGVTPSDGPLAGGTTITVTGSNFTPATTVSFGATPASSTTYVGPDEIQVVSPSEEYGVVDVTATTGSVTSRANEADGFTFESPTAQVTTVSVAASADPIVKKKAVTYTVTVTPVPDGGTVSLTDGLGPIATCGALTLTSGTAMCGVKYTSALGRRTSQDQFSVVARYSGDPEYQPSGNVLAMILGHVITGAGPPVITTTTLPAGSVDAPYGAQLDATGGTGSLHWKVTTGHLPKGLTLSKAGKITGEPQVTGAVLFTVTVTDRSKPTPQTSSADLTVTVSA